jgi:hypothetical protein
LVQENGVNGSVEVSVLVRFQVGLVPGQTEVGKVWVNLSVGQQLAALDREQVEAEVGLEVLSLYV